MLLDGWNLVFRSREAMIYTSEALSPKSREELDRLFSGGQVRETSHGVLKVSVNGHEWWDLERASPRHILRVPKVD